jgi:hypothetical protein
LIIEQHGEKNTLTPLQRWESKPTDYVNLEQNE